MNDDIDIKMKPEKRTYIFLNYDIDIKMKPEKRTYEGCYLSS